MEPLLGIPYGTSRPRVRRGLISSAVGYGAMALGAVLATLILRLIKPQAGAGFTEHTWIGFWSSVTLAGVFIALLASAAGMAIIAAQRSVLSAGDMTALALVPGRTIFGIGLSTGNLELAGSGLLRWAVDAICVLISGPSFFRSSGR